MTIELPGESRHVTVDGIKTHYLVAGEGRPLLLFHGLGASVATWRDNIGPLSEAFRVYAVDLPGHGDSEKPDIDYASDTMVDLIAHFAQALNIERPAIIGNSVGSALGLMAALRYPDLVSALVLVDSASLGREVSFYLRLVSIPLLGEVLERRKGGGTKLMLYNVFRDSGFVTQDLLDELYRSRQMPGAKEAVVRVIRNTVSLKGVRREYVLTDELSRVKAPVMVVWGAQDKIFPVSHAYQALEAAPHFRLQVFDQCGHWPHMERSTEFNSLVLEFLSQ